MPRDLAIAESHVTSIAVAGPGTWITESDVGGSLNGDTPAAC
jgi:hypothetical protein